MRISFAWPNARSAMAASDSATTVMDRFISPLPLDLFCSRLRLGPAAHRDVGVELLAGAFELHPRAVARRKRGDEVQHGGRIRHGLAPDLDEHIARLDARLVGRPAAPHPCRQRAAPAL